MMKHVLLMTGIAGVADGNDDYLLPMTVTFSGATQRCHHHYWTKAAIRYFDAVPLASVRKGGNRAEKLLVELPFPGAVLLLGCLTSLTTGYITVLFPDEEHTDKRKQAPSDTA